VNAPNFTFFHHARALAVQHGVVLRQDIEMGITGASATLGLNAEGQLVRVADTPVVLDELSYSAALHEIGHLVAPSGVPEGGAKDGKPKTLREFLVAVEAEKVAWQWARENALYWTPEMEVFSRHMFRSYTEGLRASLDSHITPLRGRHYSEMFKGEGGR
jgi:hypothetical protein